MDLTKEGLEILKGIKTELQELRRINGKVDSLEKTVEKLQTTVNRGSAISIPGVEKDKFSYCKALLALNKKDWDGAEYEREVFVEARKKALSLGSAASIGSIVPTEVADSIIELLRSKLILPNLGVTMLEGLTGSPIEFPRQTGSATGYWVAEGVAITESDQTSDLLSITPHKAAGMTRFSNTLLRTGTVNGTVEQMVRDDLAMVLARLIQTAFFHGTGAGAQPTGVFGTVGINTEAFDMTSNSTIVDSLIAMMEAIAADDAEEGEMAWVMHPRAKYRFARVKDADSNIPVLTLNGRSLVEGLEPAMLGVPYYTTSDIAVDTVATPDETDIMLGVWRQVILATWGSMELAVSSEAGTAFEQDQTLVRAIQEVDILVRHEESLCSGTDLVLSA